MDDSDDDEDEHVHSHDAGPPETLQDDADATDLPNKPSTTTANRENGAEAEPAPLPRAHLDVPPGSSSKEHVLNEFLKLHPMLSEDIFNPTVLEQLDSMLERVPICMRGLPVVDKTYEDAMLRPPHADRGERPCNLGDSCLCVFMAKLRYGPKNPYAFVCTEFLLPEQRRAWLRGSKLPDEPGKCLVCIRYFTTYLYLMARNNAHFKRTTRKFALQPHCSECCQLDGVYEVEDDDGNGRPAKRSRSARREHKAAQQHRDSSNAWHDEHMTNQALPTHANAVGTINGYRRDALLFVDDKIMQTPPMRTESISSVAFQPFVRFSSTHFQYELKGGERRLLQVNVGERESIHAREHLNGNPPSARVGPAVGAAREVDAKAA